jgi:hypothetical protein
VSIAASDLDGATVLVGITRVAKDGSVSQEQHSGVASISERETVTLVELACDDGEVRTYPFDARSLSIATPGEYRLRDTGRIVVDPHYLMTWEVEERLDS